MKSLSPLLIFFCIAFVACTPGSNNHVLSSKEKFYIDSLKLDSSIIGDLRNHTKSAIEPFHYSFSTMTGSDGSEIELDPIYLHGLVFKESNKSSRNIIMSLRDNYKKKGYIIFMVEENFGIENEPDVVGILKTTDKYEILRQMQTNGTNWDIDNDSVISIIKSFDEKYSLELIGASGEYCEFIIKNEPKSWFGLAEEVYKVCPDVVDQGSGDIKALAAEMQKTKQLYFWWD